MKPRQVSWKWLLLGLVAFLLIALAVLPHHKGSSSELRQRVTNALSTWTGATVKLTGPFSVQYFPPLSIHSGLLLTNTTRLPRIGSISASDVEISLNLMDLLLGRVSISALRLSQPKIRLKQTGATDTASDESPGSQVAKMIADAPIDVVRVSDGTITKAAGGDLVSDLDARFDASGGGGALSALGSFDFRGETVHFAVESGEVSDTKAGPSMPVTLTLTSNPVTAKLAGTATLGDSVQLDGNMRTEMANTRQFLNWVGIVLPKGESLQKLTADGAVHWSGSTLTFDDGSFTLDSNSADGLLAITMGERPRIEGTLAFEHLSLDPYLRGVEDETEAPGKPLFDWALLKYFDADLRISAGDVSASTLKLGRSGFTITAKQGVLSSEVGEIQLCGGDVAGRVDLDLSDPRTKASFAGTFENITLESCLKPFASGIPIKGVGGLTMDVSTGGTTVEELIRGLAGDLKVTAKNGAIPVDFPHLLAASSILDTDGWSHDSVTSFNSANADCRLSAGHIWCESFNMQTQGGLIFGSGDVDIGQRTLDWNLSIATPATPLNASQPVMDTPPRITIRGSLMQPSIRRADRPTLGDGSPQVSPEVAPVSPR
jgi:AsmA protein